jgi:hypothetical protein
LPLGLPFSWKSGSHHEFAIATETEVPRGFMGELEWCELTEQTATLEAAMRSRIENFSFLALLALLAFVLHQYTRVSVATAKPASNAMGPVPSFIDRGSTKFDLLFRQPELALP